MGPWVYTPCRKSVSLPPLPLWSLFVFKHDALDLTNQPITSLLTFKTGVDTFRVILLSCRSSENWFIAFEAVGWFVCSFFFTLFATRAWFIRRSLFFLMISRQLCVTVFANFLSFQFFSSSWYVWSLRAFEEIVSELLGKYGGILYNSF